MFWQSKASKRVKAFEDWCQRTESESKTRSINIKKIRGIAEYARSEGDSLHRAYMELIRQAKDAGEAALVQFDDLKKPIELRFSEQDPWIEERETLWHITVATPTTLSVTNERIHRHGEARVVGPPRRSTSGVAFEPGRSRRRGSTRGFR